MSPIKCMEVNSCLEENTLLGIGNSLVDIAARVDKEFLDKHGIKEDDQIKAGEEHRKIYEEVMQRNDLDYRAGGDTYNAIKIAQWMLQDPRKISTYIGWIGKDKIAEIFKQDNIKYNIDAYLYGSDGDETCTAISCICGQSRSLITYGYLLRSFRTEFMDTEVIQNLIDKAKYIYMSCYFFNVSEEIILRLAQHSSKNDKIFILNLSAAYVIRNRTETVLKLIPHADVLFGNKDEALAFSEVNDFNTTDLERIVIKIRELPKENNKRERIVVITQGPDDVVVCTKDDVKFYPANHVDADKIIDTTAAGDAFAGGFISQMLLNKSIEECVSAGNYAASTVIQHIGCSVPERPISV